MVATSKLKGLLAEKGFSYEKMAKKIGITSKTFGEKMKTGRFYSDEMQVMVDVLEISDPATIFFARNVT